MFEYEGVQFLLSDDMCLCWLNIRTFTEMGMQQKSNKRKFNSFQEVYKWDVVPQNACVNTGNILEKQNNLQKWPA